MRVMRVSGHEIQLFSASPLSSAIIAGGICSAATQLVFRRAVSTDPQIIGHNAFNGKVPVQANCQKTDALSVPINEETCARALA